MTQMMRFVPHRILRAPTYALPACVGRSRFYTGSAIILHPAEALCVPPYEFLGEA